MAASTDSRRNRVMAVSTYTGTAISSSAMNAVTQSTAPAMSSMPLSENCRVATVSVNGTRSNRWEMVMTARDPTMRNNARKKVEKPSMTS